MTAPGAVEHLLASLLRREAGVERRLALADADGGTFCFNVALTSISLRRTLPASRPQRPFGQRLKILGESTY